MCVMKEPTLSHYETFYGGTEENHDESLLGELQYRPYSRKLNLQNTEHVLQDWYL
jgi:hypothetical protein